LMLSLLAVGCNNGARSERAEAPKPTAGSSTATALASATPSATPTVTPLRLLTYNVLASPIFPQLRREAVFAVLKASKADIIALQEVPRWMLKPLVEQPWVRRDYQVTPAPGGVPYAPGGQLIISRHPIERTAADVLVGKQSRTVLVAQLRIDGRVLAVATSHLESYLEDGPMRARQLDAIFPMLAGADDAVLMGDLNFGDGAKPETDHLDASYVDVWTVLQPGKPGFTWNNEENPMARIGAFAKEPSRRLDRILVRSTHWRPTSVRIIGNQSAGERKLTLRDRAMIEMPERRQPDAGEPNIAVFPSDHYGVMVELE